MEDTSKLSRRSFLAGAALTGMGVASLGLGVGGTSQELIAAEKVYGPASEPPLVPVTPIGTNGTVEAGYLSYFDWLGYAPQISDSQITETIEADIVVVGGGDSGVPTALAAAEAGASVVVVEEQEEESYTFFGNDIGHLNSKWAESRGGYPVDEVEFIQDWSRRSVNRCNYELLQQMARKSGETVDWIVEHLPQSIVDNAGIYCVPKPSKYPGEASGYKAWSGTTIHFEAEEGTSLPDVMRTLKAAAEAKGATWYFSTKAEVLTKEGNTVTGVIGSLPDGSYKRFVAKKGVVLSTGDFSGNPAMVFALNEELRAYAHARGQNCAEIVGIGRKGAGQKMGCWAGGRIEPGPYASMGRAMGAAGFGGIAILQLNRDGKRFMNEAMLSVWGNLNQVMRQPKGQTYSVADAGWFDFVQKCAPEHVYPGTGGFHDGGFLDSLKEEMDKVPGTGTEGYRVRGSVTYAGDTLDELADNMGLSGDLRTNFFASITRYNELAKKGVDEDFGKDSYLMEALENPPYYASLLDNTTLRLGLVEIGGLVTDGNQQVLDFDDYPIPGLCATGNCCGGRFALQYATPIAGISIGWATTMGKILGERLATL